jgi:hypothetical protein
MPKSTLPAIKIFQHPTQTERSQRYWDRENVTDHWMESFNHTRFLLSGKKCKISNKRYPFQI